jgi:aminoglycoside phosphotransferase (APT) family kinase protein
MDTTNAPLAGKSSFYRGSNISAYDKQTKEALFRLQDKIDTKLALEIWESTLATSWEKTPVWLHGDISTGNLLVDNGRLSAVIDFSGVCIGDPACDFAIAWTFFDTESRRVFKETLQTDDATWLRGCAWALWKALIVEAGLTDTNAVEKQQSSSTLKTILSDFHILKGI